MAGLARRGGLLVLVAVIGHSWLGCAHGGGAGQGDLESDSAGASWPLEHRIDGTVAYRERFALPAGSLVRVMLRDASQLAADPARAEVAREEIVTAGEQVPIRFELLVDGASIDALRPYELDAEIEVDGQVRFALDFPMRVLTRGEPSTVDLVLRDPYGAP
jgi:putative lipoprotein